MQQTESNLSVYYHTHWDREWYMPFRAYQVRLAEVVDEILDRLDKNELPCFTLDGQTVVLEDYLELRPENRERLSRYIQAGKLSIGPWYVMPDEFLVGGESLIRNLMRGIRESRAWGYDCFTGYLPDTFGHSADMPTILRGFGIDSAILWRGLNPEKSMVTWKSPTGASVRTLHLTDGYFQMMLDDWTATPDEQMAALDTLIGKLRDVSPQDGIGLVPMGADHMGPLPAAGRKRLLERYPGLKETTPDRFMNALNGLNGLKTAEGELTDNSAAYLLPGVWSSRMYLKQANRRLEHKLVHQLEPLLAMTQALLPEGTVRYPVHELDLAWKTLMLNHPHDSICGCSVDEVHRENEVRFDQVQELTDCMQVRAEQALLQLADDNHWVVFNTGDKPYRGAVLVTEDTATQNDPTRLSQALQGETVLADEYLHSPHHIPLAHLTRYRRQGWIWVDNVPARGMAAIPKDAKDHFPPIQAGKDSLENETLKIQVEPDGTLTVTDKVSGRAYRGLLTFEAHPVQGDSYNHAPDTSQNSLVAQFIPRSNGDYLTPDSGALCGELQLTHQFTVDSQKHVFFTAIRLKAGDLYLECDIVADPNFLTAMDDYKVQVRFSTGQPLREVMAETHLGVVSRKYDPDYREADHMPVARMKELKTNTGPVQRFFSANGQSWMTEGLTEYEVTEDAMLITLSRPFMYLSQADTGVRGSEAGPPLETLGGLCWYRELEGRFAWIPTPHTADQLYEAAGRFYGNVWGFSGRGRQVQSSALSLVSWDNPALVSSACYWLPGRGLLLRLINTSQASESTQLTAGFENRNIRELNLLEEVMGTVANAMVTIGPRDVKTLLLEV